MLTRFEVANYKGFKDAMIWDLSTTRDYSYSKELIKNKTAKNSIVFGKNASGKSSLCAAVVDITTHLLDAEKDSTPPHMLTYIGNDTPIMSFRYDFLFGIDIAAANTVNIVFIDIDSAADFGKFLFVHGYNLIV